MFYETNSPSWSTDWAGRFHRPAFYDDPEWRNTSSVFGNSGSMPGSPQSSRVRRGWTTEFDEGGVPIKVVHETTGGGASSHDDANDAASETSSQGSRSSCSSARSGGGGANGASCSKSRHEPRVHHIPIMVEPRTGASSSSTGYASDGEIKPQSQARRTFAAGPSPKESQQQQQPASGEPRNVHTIPIEVDGYPMQGQARSPSSHNHHHNEEMAGEAQNVRTVPIEMDCGDEAMARCRVDDPMDEQDAGEKSWPHTFPRQKCQQSARRGPSTSKSSSGGRLGPQAAPAKQGSEPPQQQETKKQSPAEEQIRRISLELADLRQQVLNFNGRPGDKQYKFLDEMLTRLMIKLDAVDPAGRDDVRQLRKSMIREVQSVINLLEGRPSAGALVEVASQDVEELGSEVSQCNEDGDSDSPSDATGAAAVAASAAPEVSPEVPPPPAVQRVGSKDEKGDTPMEVEAPATSEAQPPPSVEMVPATSGGSASAEELPPAPELPTIPMPVDIDASLAGSSGNSAEGPTAGSASPFNEQNLSSLNNSEVESTHIEGTIPTEHSGSTEL